MLFHKPIVLALLLNLLFLLLYFTFGIVKHGSLDDYFMSSVLTGAYGSTYDVHMYFVNAAYGYFLKPFYLLFPKVGWYFIFELAGTFAAFTTFSYFLVRRMGVKMGCALSALLLASLSPDFYFQLSFTQCATIYTAAGMLSFFFAVEEKKYLLLGGLFLIAGSIMRWEGFLLGMPYIALFIAYLFFVRKTNRKECVIVLLICFTAIYALHLYDRSLYTEGDYKYYAEYQPVRSFFGDGAYYDKESTFDELQERNMHGQDFRLLKSWMFYDTEVFSVDSLLPIIDVANNNLYVPNPKRMFVAFFWAVSRELTCSIGWCWVVFCLLLMFSKSRMSGLYPWFSLCVIAASIGYLLLLNRLAHHVESGIWLYAIVCCMPLLETDILKTTQFMSQRHGIVIAILLVLVVFFSYVGISGQGSRKEAFKLVEREEKISEWKAFSEYANEHAEDVFLLSFERYKDLGTYRNPSYVAIEPGSWNNIFSWGYWNIHLPAMKQELLKRGVQNPIKDIVQGNVYLIEDDNKPLLREFYKLHYGDSLWVDTVRAFGDLMLLKYHSTKNEDVGEEK